jgi:hypothetical protein
VLQDGAAIPPAGLQDGPRRHRIEVPERALQVGPVAGLDQGKEPGQPRYDPGAGSGVVNVMAIDAAQAAIRLVIAGALVENGESSGRGFDALFAMRQAEAVVRALELSGYEIRRRI